MQYYWKRDVFYFRGDSHIDFRTECVIMTQETDPPPLLYGPLQNGIFSKKCFKYP